jgi:hypothetical protein
MVVPNLHFVQLARPYSFASPVPGQEFAAWVVASDETLTNDERHTISAQLVAAGCRYAVCSGIDCSGWDDALDWAYLETCADYDPKDENFVMTSWHEDEDIATIANFFAWNMAFDEWVASELIVIAVGGSGDAQAALESTRAILESRRARTAEPAP